MTQSTRIAPLFIPALVLGLALLPACSSSDKEGGEGEGVTDEGASGSDDSNSADGDDEADDDENASNGVVQPITPDEALIEGNDEVTSMSVFGVLTDECEGISQEPEQIKAPVDIIFVIDNSSSMAGEIEQVQERINEDFARIIEASDVDYRVIMIARYGDVNQEVGESDHPVCIRAPLGAGDCANPSEEPLLQNAPRFFHYSADVRSREPWCDVLEGFDTPDELTLDDEDARPWTQVAPIGWRQFLREEAFKHFVVISDDNSECSRNGWDFDDRSAVVAGQNAARDFDTELLALSPRQFGSNVNRNYKWHSIVGLGDYTDSLTPWPPSEPIQTDTCNPGSEGPGTGFQALSVLTGGLRYPSCNNENFDAVFQALAETVVHGSLSCEWTIPEVENFSTDAVNMRWVDGSGIAQVIVNVETAEDCVDGGGWHFDDNDAPSSVVACPETCALLQSDPNGRVDLLFGCSIVTRGPEAR